ncbi:MAG: helix-turn-helix transcriptional regulator [Bacteroidia bacterium]
MQLGQTIESLRKKRGLNQIEMAKCIGISQTYLSQVENNRKDPNLSVLKKIASCLETPLPIIFFLSLEKEDVPENKKAAFDVLFPAIDSMVKEFFTRQLAKP